MLINKVLYYVKLAIKKPHLVVDFIYKKHIGLVFLMPIIKKNLEQNNDFEIKKSIDVKEIHSFYKKMNRDSLTELTIDNWLKNDTDCFLAILNGEIVGAMCFFKKQIHLNGLSGSVLSTNKVLAINKKTLYMGYVIIDKDHRGKGIYKLMSDKTLSYYSESTDYKYIFFTTGIGNSPVIKNATSNNAKIIAITKVVSLVGKINRKEIYWDNKNIKNIYK